MWIGGIDLEGADGKTIFIRSSPSRKGEHIKQRRNIGCDILGVIHQ